MNIFFFKILLNVDIVANMSRKMVYIYAAIFIVLLIVSIIFSKLLTRKNMNKKWMNWLLHGSGSQVDEALGFLREIKDFERK